MALFTTYDRLTGMANALARLASDVAYLSDNGAPSESMLSSAPILNSWAPAIAPTICLVGSVSGHPRLGCRPLIHTSELFAMDELAGWARTWSRWYRLGIPKDGFEGGGNA